MNRFMEVGNYRAKVARRLGTPWHFHPSAVGLIKAVLGPKTLSRKDSFAFCKMPSVTERQPSAETLKSLSPVANGGLISFFLSSWLSSAAAVHALVCLLDSATLTAGSLVVHCPDCPFLKAPSFL